MNIYCHPYLEWALRSEFVKPERREQADDASGYTLAGFRETAQFIDFGILHCVEASCDST
jgi:hypothetical protein